MIQLREIHPATVNMEQVADSAESAAMRDVLLRFERNSAWFQAHATEIFSHRGKFIAIAGEQLFVGDTVQEAVAQALAAHPDDTGTLTRYVPAEQGARVYANRRIVAAV